MSTRQNTVYIEEKTINHLKTALTNTKRIRATINTSNNDVSWDGDLTLYSSEDKLGYKEYLVGRIPVQVKGTTTDTTKNGKLVYSVSVADLKNYKTDGGCIYFVIYQSGEELKIFYEQFLPFDIEMILKNIGDKKNKTIYFPPFPTDKTIIIELMRSFIINREKQVSTAKYAFDFNTSDSRITQNIKDFEFTTVGRTKNPIDDCFDIPTYVYANTTIGIQFPIDRINKIICQTEYLCCNISVNGMEYYNRIKIRQSRFDHIIEIGNCTAIEIHKPKTDGKAKISFLEKGMLSDRIRDYKFWITVCLDKDSKIAADGIFVDRTKALEEAMREMPENNINNMNERFEYLKNIKGVLYSFGVTADLDMDNFSEEDHIALGNLFLANRGKIFSTTFDEVPKILSLNIANLDIILHAENLGNGKYKVHNFSKLQDLPCISEYNGEKFVNNPFFILHKNDMIEYINIDYEVVYNSIISVSVTPIYLAHVNLFLLYAVGAYDEKKTADLLTFIDKISCWLLSNSATESHQLNRLQVEKRKRVLTREEYSKLRHIVHNSDDTISKMCACILLESFAEAKSFWDILTEEEIHFIKSHSCFPIFNLWTEHKPEM